MGQGSTCFLLRGEQVELHLSRSWKCCIACSVWRVACIALCSDTCGTAGDSSYCLGIEERNRGARREELLFVSACWQFSSVPVGVWTCENWRAIHLHWALNLVCGGVVLEILLLNTGFCCFFFFPSTSLSVHNSLRNVGTTFPSLCFSYLLSEMCHSLEVTTMNEACDSFQG